MKTTKKLGIWMDHSMAHLMEFTSKHFEIETIESELSNQEKIASLAKSENSNFSKERKQLFEYYKKIGETIKNYKRVILFGPTDAKIELFDLLSEDTRFLKIKFEIKDTDKMDVNQQHNFVKEYFSRA
jgi:stalled ribosome rescue protein Dom34